MEYSVATENVDIHLNIRTCNDILNRKNNLTKQHIFIRFHFCFKMGVCVSTEKGLKGYSSK